MNQDKKAELFQELATAVDSYAWVSANLLKEQFGVIDDEEEYKKIEQEVVAYVQSDEFKSAVLEQEVAIMDNIANVALTTKQELLDGNN